MKDVHASVSWSDLLPKAYSWLEKVNIDSCGGVVSGAQHLVVAQSDSDGDEKGSKGSFVIDAPGLDADLRQKIVDGAIQQGWQTSSAGMATVVVDGVVFSLVAGSKLAVSNSQKARQIGIGFAKYLKGRDVDHVVLCQSATFPALDMFDGLVQGYYHCHVFKGAGVETESADLPAKIGLLGSTASADAISKTVAMAKAITFTRQLQDAPPNFLDSVRFGEIAKEVSENLGLKCTLKGRDEIKKLGMGAFNSVADGTPVDPRLIAIEIEGKDTSKTIALVGKGLTFDAGGISIKPSAGMHEMKYDMSGGAAVLGAAVFLGHVKPAVNVVCLIGAVENMPGVSATRPGDVVRAMNGKSIEVLNTDAEGRLVLADILYYAATEFKPAMMIDIATLTGAVLHGLGTVGGALMTNERGTGDYLLNVSKEVGEPFWELPLWPEFEKEIKSEVADYRNIASPSVKGGTIVAGVFLKEFVNGVNWAHLDIAGTGWNCKTTGYPSSGGSAYGLRIMAEACLMFNK